MIIQRIDIYHVAMPLIYPFRTAYGNDDTIESVLVCMTDGHHQGWGEAAPWRYPAYSPECAAALLLLARDFIAPNVLGATIPNADILQTRMSMVKGNPFAKSAFDMAWWDLHAQQHNQPLWKIIGGVNPIIEAGADFGVMETIDALLAAIDHACKTGYRRVKLKFRPGWDIDMVAAVRSTFPNLTMHIDCNSAYTLDDTPMFKHLDQYNLAMIEQPLAHDDLIDHAALQRAIATPICLDESITSCDKARKAIQLQACRWINLKPGRMGGITPVLRTHDLCQNQNIPCWIGGMLESSIGAHHCLALATLANIRYPSDIFPSERFYRNDLGRPSMSHTCPPMFAAPGVPGCGAIPDPVQLEALTLAHVEIR